MTEPKGDKPLECEKTLLNHNWRYFELHANQRITLFRFYIALFALFVSASGFQFIRFYHSGFLAEFGEIILSLAFLVFTWVFRKLDKRNRELVHLAEDGLREIEESMISNNSMTRVFGRENASKKSEKSISSHTECFDYIFNAGYVAAVLLIIISLICICLYSN